MAFNITRTDYSTGSRVETVETVGVGTTLMANWETVQVMSDIWERMYVVTHWSAEKNRAEVTYLEKSDSVTIDFTPEVLRAYVKMRAIGFSENRLAQRERNLQDEHKKVVKDARVTVTGGRNSKDLIGQTFPVVAVITKVYNAGPGRSYEAPLAALAMDDEMKEVIGKNGRTYQNHANVRWVWAMHLEVAGAAEKIAASMALVQAEVREETLKFAKDLVEKLEKQKSMPLAA
jgi:hypothetical protein